VLRTVFCAWLLFCSNCNNKLIFFLNFEIQSVILVQEHSIQIVRMPTCLKIHPSLFIAASNFVYRQTNTQTVTGKKIQSLFCCKGNHNSNKIDDCNSNDDVMLMWFLFVHGCLIFVLHPVILCSWYSSILRTWIVQWIC